jgi:hypothetical protein
MELFSSAHDETADKPLPPTLNESKLPTKKRRSSIP